MLQQPTRLVFSWAVLASFLSAAHGQVKTATDIEGLPARIAFGSCGHQDKPQPILKTIVAKDPDVMIYLGDNIYGDTLDMSVLQQKYDRLGRKPEFQTLRQRVPTLAVWDDHDYGWNDAGKEYRFKRESKQIFMDFWHVADDSPRRSREGIYGQHRFESGGRILQIILLDTRSFRDPLRTVPQPLPEGTSWKNAYAPDPDESKTLLGEDQWTWLEQTLKRPADLRIICSSIQFGHEYNGWESWTNLPREQERMVDLIRSQRANGVIFLSGDVHWGEISRRTLNDLYPLYDVTASGLTEDWHNVEPNRFRLGDPYRENHFGWIEIDWEAKPVDVQLAIVGLEGHTQVHHRCPLTQLQFTE